MTVGDHLPEEPLPEEPGRAHKTYELIYEVSDRARALAPAIAGILRATVMLLTIPALFFAVSAAFPIIGTAIIASGASGFALILLTTITVIALIIEVLFIWRTRSYMRSVKDPDFVDEVAQLVDIADLSDEFVNRLQGAASASNGLGMKRLRSLWDLWRTPSYLNDRIDSLTLVRHFVPPRINLNIKLAVFQFWSTLIMWGVLIIALIARLSGAI